MPALYITEAEVAAHIDMETALEAVANIMPAYVRGEVVDYPRQRVRLPHSMMHMLQAGIPAYNLTGYKAYTSAGGKARFWVHLYDATTGEAVAVIEADLLGMLRTGAAGGVAARALARADSQSVALFGAGWQAEGQVRALAAVFPNLARIQVSARNAERIASFCERMKETTGLDIIPAPSAEAAVREADIVVTVTTSPKPLFEAEWLRAGTHITAAGSNSLVRREISEATLKRVDVICVDSRE
ncbi:MAG: ornithine cyclodeaminase family protein, partial [Rhodocyclaceae bacterium]|nr:ornithine cyclodeaminase family protein [Rhodocyclaceae bacterium]